MFAVSVAGITVLTWIALVQFAGASLTFTARKAVRDVITLSESRRDTQVLTAEHAGNHFALTASKRTSVKGPHEQQERPPVREISLVSRKRIASLL